MKVRKGESAEQTEIAEQTEKRGGITWRPFRLFRYFRLFRALSSHFLLSLTGVYFSDPVENQKFISRPST
jgi:hypothetical protein